MGAEQLANADTQEGLKKLMINDLKQATAPETPPRTDVVTHGTLNNGSLGQQQSDDAQSQGIWQELPRQYELSDFQPIKKLYRGYASKVYLADDLMKGKSKGKASDSSADAEGRRVVLKVYDLLRLSPLTKYQLDREIRLHASINHKNIIRLEAAFTQTDFAILVQDYAANGDLYTYLHKQRIKYSERRLVRSILKPCIDALSYLHTRNIAHRDIKPENLLLDGKYNIKLADFGLSICVTEESAVTRAGTLDYMAPEVIVCPLKRLPSDFKDRNDLAYTVKVDCWSLGVLAFELLVGKTPYRHRDEVDMLQTIQAMELKFPPDVSELAQDWVQRAVTMDVNARASIFELSRHPWITSNMRATQITSHRPTAPESSLTVKSHQTNLTPSEDISSLPSSSTILPIATAVNHLAVPGPGELTNKHNTPETQPSPAEHMKRSTAEMVEESGYQKSSSRTLKTASSFMKHISALKPSALFGGFRDRSTKDDVDDIP